MSELTEENVSLRARVQDLQGKLASAQTQKSAHEARKRRSASPEVSPHADGSAVVGVGEGGKSADIEMGTNRAGENQENIAGVTAERIMLAGDGLRSSTTPRGWVSTADVGQADARASVQSLDSMC